ncbi:hydantoinase/oxoprolinase family protein [Amorphus sp. 3PC139-8]|uniref:hydantoinase/oxoprolinase family protein n=1 Tax=Amorphus sp. 3PC139-8 TaxID=2735676 RepID=UPI00345D52A7
MQKQVRIGVDIGGTFTDFVLEDGARQFSLKLLTTTDAPERAVIEGVREILAIAEVPATSVTAIVHGTTLATNAVIERKGAKVGFVTTEGFRDTLEMAYEHRYDQYDLLVDKPLPLVPRQLRFPVTERIGVDGRVLKPLDEAAVRAVGESLRNEGVEAVAIGFLQSFANHAHEERAADILREMLPGVPVSVSSDVSPEIREYERFTTVTANAYVQPLMSRYLGRLDTGLRDLGIAAPIYLIQSNGGLCDIATASRFPVRLLESGPAGGAIFAASLANELKIDKALLLDIGGTTAKLCFIDDGKPQTARGMEVARIDRFKPGSGLPLRFPVVELCEMGAGGGSIARIDRLGRLAVGPQSAGSTPGPACYGRGGSEATVTDAHLALGRLDPDRFAAGTVKLTRDKAERALSASVGDKMGLATDKAAVGVIEIANENMANAAREHAIEVGHGTAGRTLIAIGGAAALHAADLAAKLDMAAVVVPQSAGVGSAVGFLRAPVAFEKARSQHQILTRFDAKSALSVIDVLAADTAAEIANAAEHEAPRVSVSAQMRYRGQGHEITVPVDHERLGIEGATYLRTTFAASYDELYGRTIAGKDIEILAWTVRSELPIEAASSATSAEADASISEQSWEIVEQSGRTVTARVLDRTALGAEETTEGPLLVVDTGTTILVPTGFTARVIGAGHLILERSAAKGADA